MKKYLFRLLISLFILLNIKNFANCETFVSTSPSMTEIMYALGADDKLKAVSSECSYPIDAKNKPIIGNTYYINMEMLLKIKPDYFLAPDSAEFMLNKIKKFDIEPLCFKYKNIEDIYKNIKTLGKLTSKKDEADELISFIQNKIKNSNKNLNKKILYIIQEEPIIVPAKNSFLNDVIKKSGNKLITDDINSYYPIVSVEYLINKKPDIIVLDYYCKDTKKLEKFFPNTKIIKMTKQESEIINRPSNRIWMGVEYFSNLPF